MSRKRATVDLAGVVASIGVDHDEINTRLLDAAEALLRERGLRQWSLDDVADIADAGRTTVYRRFGGRDELVHAVLARELQATLSAIGAAVDAASSFEDKAVASVTTALRSLNQSVVDSLLRSDADTFLPFLTTEAGPLVSLATTAIDTAIRAETGVSSPLLAEAAARIGLSFVLTRPSVLPLTDAKKLEAAVRDLVRSLFSGVVAA